MFHIELKNKDITQTGMLLSQIHAETTVHTVGNLATENLEFLALSALTYYNHAINLNNKHHQ